MKLALWRKTVRDAALLTVCCAAVLFGFCWLFVWLTSLVPQPKFLEMIKMLPKELQQMVGMPIETASKPLARIALSYVHPLMYIIGAVWGIARGSDAVAGPLDRGTLEMVLAQPVRRGQVLLCQAVVTVGGAAIIATAAWLGTAAGIATVKIEETTTFFYFWQQTRIVPLSGVVSPLDYVSAAVNFFSLTVFIGALTTLVSSCDRYRWRSVGLVSGFCLIEFIIQICYRVAPRLSELSYMTFFGLYQPHRIVAMPDRIADFHFFTLPVPVVCVGLLLAGGLACYLAAGIVLSRRDLPAPL